MREQHEAERERLEEEMARQQIPAVKYSSELLNSQFKFEQLIKNKKYQTAKLLKERMDTLIDKENEEWEVKFLGQREKQKELLRKKQTNEYEALKTRLEKSINTKLKMRMNDYDKLLQRIQNLQNELITKQTLQFSRIQSANAKILYKYDLNLNELANASMAKDYSMSDISERGRTGKSGRENLPDGIGVNGQKKGLMKPIMEKEENEMLSDNRFKGAVSLLESKVRCDVRPRNTDGKIGDGGCQGKWTRQGRRSGGKDAIVLEEGQAEWTSGQTVRR